MSNIRRTKEDTIFDYINYFILFIVLIIVIYPLYFIVIASISEPNAILSGNVWFWPVGTTLEGYVRIFNDSKIWVGYLNTIIYTVSGTIINVIFTMLLAYPLSRKDYPLRKFTMMMIMITMYFNGGLIPTFLVVQNLGLVNSGWVMIVLGAVNVFNVIIAKTFLESIISPELYEAASIDGCSDFIFFYKIVLPLSKSIIAVLTLYYGVAHWNEFMKALIYLRDDGKYPLQLILRGILVENQITELVGDVETEINRQRTAELIKYGVIIVSSLPVLIIYPFLQKYFVKGVMIGSVKG